MSDLKPDMEQKESRLNIPAIAIADAMMHVQAIHLNYDEYFSQTYGDQVTPLSPSDYRAKMAEDLTRNKCFFSCEQIIRYLFSRYPKSFDVLVTISAEWQTKTLRNGWNTHCNFLARDINKIWYSGSPANFIPHEDTNRLTSIISSPDLGAVLEKIKETDLGLWPEKDFILSEIVPYRSKAVPDLDAGTHPLWYFNDIRRTTNGNKISRTYFFDR